MSNNSDPIRDIAVLHTARINILQIHEQFLKAINNFKDNEKVNDFKNQHRELQNKVASQDSEIASFTKQISDAKAELLLLEVSKHELTNKLSSLNQQLDAARVNANKRDTQLEKLSAWLKVHESLIRETTGSDFANERAEILSALTVQTTLPSAADAADVPHVPPPFPPLANFSVPPAPPEMSVSGAARRVSFSVADGDSSLSRTSSSSSSSSTSSSQRSKRKHTGDKDNAKPSSSSSKTRLNPSTKKKVVQETSRHATEENKGQSIVQAVRDNLFTEHTNIELE